MMLTGARFPGLNGTTSVRMPSWRSRAPDVPSSNSLTDGFGTRTSTV